MKSIEVTAFRCPECLALYENAMDSGKCISNHKREAAHRARAKREKLIKLKKLDQFRNELERFDGFEEAIKELALERGYLLTFSKIAIGGVDLACASNSSPIDSDVKYSHFDDINNKLNGYRPAIVVRMSGTLLKILKSSNKPYCFFNFLKEETIGINVFGSGDSNFGCNATLWVEDFPKIKKDFSHIFPYKEKRAKFLSMLSDRAEWIEERRTLIRLYKTDYLPAKQISDPTWAILDSDIKELEEEINESNLKLIGMRQELDKRTLFLDDEREARTKPKREFDEALYSKMSRFFKT